MSGPLSCPTAAAKHLETGPRAALDSFSCVPILSKAVDLVPSDDGVMRSRFLLALSSAAVLILRGSHQAWWAWL